MRLIAFPHAGGAASTYLPLSRALAPAIDVLAVQYPGRQNRLRERPVADIAELADALTEEVLGLDERPCAFFGHSMGAVLAYEVARRLQERGERGPVRLFLSGRNAPSSTPSRNEQMHDDADVLATVRRLGGTVSAILEDPALLELAMPALRADYRAIGSYRWREGEPLSVPFTVMLGVSDPVASVARASAWSALTTAATDVKVFDGGHFYLDHRLREVARTVTAALHAPAMAG
ncbi:thioesterase II family protein [Streptomyces sp. NPDC002446]